MGLSTWFFIFLKAHKICNRLIDNMAIFGKPPFSPYAELPGATLLQGGFLLILSIWFLKITEITENLQSIDISYNYVW